MVFCTKCGTKNDDDMRFCIKCGASLDAQAPEVGMAAAQPVVSAPVNNTPANYAPMNNAPVNNAPANNTPPATTGEGWYVNEDALIITYANQPLTKLQSGNRYPWDAFKKQIKNLILVTGIYVISEDIFSDFENLESIMMPGNITAIKSGAFRGCKSLKSIKIPECVTTIGSGAFADCTGLERITLSDKVMIEEKAFAHCRNIKEVIWKGTTYASMGAYYEAVLGINENE